MSEDPSVDEGDLHAWVDDRLDPARRRQVDRHLDRNPALRRRVEDWAGQAAALRQALRADDDEERAALFRRLARSRPRPARSLPSRLAIAAGVVLAAALGGVGGWAVRSDQRPSEITRLGVEAATTYQVLQSSVRPASPVEGAADRPALATLLTQGLGRPTQVPDLAAMGYQLTGGRLVAAINGPAALLLYTDASGNRLTIYLQPMQVGNPAPMRPVQASPSLNAYAWIEQRTGYMVISDAPKDRVHAAADRVLAATRL